MAKQSVRVHIFNQSYTVAADESEVAQLQDLAHEIDELMTTIAGRAGTGDAARVAVLASLHLADKLRTAENRLKERQDESGRIAEMTEMLESAING
jgi:cell division protein ZapA